GYVERYTRDGDARVARITYLAQDQEMGRTEFTYSVGAAPSQVAFFTPTGAPATAPVGPCLGAHRVVLGYNEGRVEERVLFEADGSLKQRSVFRYDSAGNVISEIRSSEYGEDRFRHEYEYDDHGNWVVRTSTTEFVSRRSGPSGAVVKVTRRSVAYQ